MHLKIHEKNNLKENKKISLKGNLFLKIKKTINDTKNPPIGEKINEWVKCL